MNKFKIIVELENDIPINFMELSEYIRKYIWNKKKEEIIKLMESKGFTVVDLKIETV
ncbi:MAG: hypothetical protein WC901_00980 [Candidatus Margulisiibacteriota bacterium]